MRDNFYICKGYKIKFLNKKKIILFHTPKCAGTTICNILSKLIINSFRVLGPLTPLSGFKVQKPQLTAEENFENNKNSILKNNNFIYGHFSINLLKYFSKRLSIAILRDPIERSISHYNFQIERNSIREDSNIQMCYEKGFIPDNIITRQFCGNFNKKTLDQNDYKCALDNLNSKIDLIFDVTSSIDLINSIISEYNLPNVIFQKQQITKKNSFNNTEENISIIKNYNFFDMNLYNQLKEKNLFFSKPKEITPRNHSQTLFWPQNYKNYKNEFLFLKTLEADKLIKNQYITYAK